MIARVYRDKDGARLAAIQSPSGVCFIGRKVMNGPFQRVTPQRAPELSGTKFTWETVQRRLDEYAEARGLKEV